MMPAACALLGLSLTMAGCGAGNASSLGSPQATPKAAPASTTTTPPAPFAVTRVVADCTSALPYRLSLRPAAIALACADNGWGVEDMTWTSWTASVATGHGMFWDKLCEPSCAAGKIGTYPVAVTLSAAKTSPRGQWFSLLTVTWEAAKPPRPAPGSFRLTPPRT
jgi:hypothetical protein